MPQTEYKSNKNSLKYVNAPIEKAAFNPFPDLYEANYGVHKSKKPTSKLGKKSGKCFQLILICQKLLKPFSSSHKTLDSETKKINTNYKEKSLSTPQINLNERLRVHKPYAPIEKIDVSIQTNIQSISDGNHHAVKKAPDPFLDSTYFLKDNEVQTDDYWDLDIDSAIVGDYNSVSEMSLDDQIDPHYATIKMLNDSKSTGKFDCITNGSIFSTSFADRIDSNTSSPKSGIYSKINKSKITDQTINFNLPLYNYLASRSNPKLNFDQIMMIKSQLGLSREIYAFDHDSAKLHFPSDQFVFNPSIFDSRDTPDLPKRNYGSSVINLIAKLREERDPNQSLRNLSVHSKCVTLDSDQVSKISDIYSPIWSLKKKTEKPLCCENTPLSEPTIPRRALKTMLDHLNPVFKDDSSEEASSISFYSPLRNKYSYPRNFTENYPHKIGLDNLYNTMEREVVVDEMGMFRHMDSEVDVSLSYNSSDVNDLSVPLENKRNDICFNVEDKLFLEPLMERSFEEDFFLRDITSSLEYINV